MSAAWNFSSLNSSVTTTRQPSSQARAAPRAGAVAPQTMENPIPAPTEKSAETATLPFPAFARAIAVALSYIISGGGAARSPGAGHENSGPQSATSISVVSPTTIRSPWPTSSVDSTGRPFSRTMFALPECPI